MMHFTKEDTKISKEKIDSVPKIKDSKISSENITTTNNFNQVQQVKNQYTEIRRHTDEEEEINYAVFFMTLGLGFGLVFGKFIFGNIPIAMCTGTLLGLLTGILYSKYSKKRADSKGE